MGGSGVSDTVIGKLLSLQAVSAFRYPGFSYLFMASVLSFLGRYMMLVGLGWLVLEITNSSVSLGLVWAISALPNLLFGVLAGVVIDKFDRRQLIIWAFIIIAVGAFLIGLLSSKNALQLWHILLVSFMMGSAATVGLPARQAFTVDIVGPGNAMNAISVSTAGTRIIGLFSGALAGVVIELLGVEWCFYIMGLSYVSASLIVLRIHRRVMEPPPRRQTIRDSYVTTLRLITKNKIVLALVLTASICEVFGFSYPVVLPIFARDILAIGAVGLGMFYAAESLGGLLGGLVLASLGDYRHKGWLILCTVLSLGVFLVLFSQTSWHLLSLFFMAMLGASTAVIDAMEHTILQLNVPDDQRGRVMGIWMMSIGFGPVGRILIGVVAALLGVQLAVSINGIVMIAIFFLLVALVPKLRRA